MQSPDAIVIGAGPAGLATAQCLRAAGLAPIILDKADAVGAAWRRHYDRLHLHTPRAHSSLPGMALPAAYGRYPSRAQFVSYLECYTETFDLRPVLGAQVEAVRRDGARWRVEAGAHSASAPVVVVATGWADFPYRPNWPGMDTFEGAIVHSGDYRNGAPYAGKRVLVVGFGNSGAEIALDLCEGGAHVTLAVRSPVRILPRDLLGLPILDFAIAQRFLPPRIADALNAPALRLAIGSIESLGMRKAAKGPLQMIAEDGRVPVIDVGTVAKIRAGAIAVRGDIERITRDGVVFAETGPERFDAMILATGFRPDLRRLLPDAQAALTDDGAPRVSDVASAEPGLFFVGAIASPTGQLRQIGIGARSVATLARRFVDEHALA